MFESKFKIFVEFVVKKEVCGIRIQVEIMNEIREQKAEFELTAGHGRTEQSRIIEENLDDEFGYSTNNIEHDAHQDHFVGLVLRRTNQADLFFTLFYLNSAVSLRCGPDVVLGEYFIFQFPLDRFNQQNINEHIQEQKEEVLSLIHI